MPRVSIIIPTYNCDQFLGRAIDSALSQSYTDYEVLVVDDGSTDDTPNVVAPYGQRIRYFHQGNRGVSAARNLALSHATGEFVAYLDADDMWYPEKLATQVAFLDIHQDCGLVHTEVSVIDEDDKIIHVHFNQETKRSVPHGVCLNDLLRRCHIQTLTVLERRQCLDRAGLFDERLPIAQDYHHWIKVALHGSAIGYLSMPLAKYRWRSGSLMGNQGRLLADLVLIYEELLQKTTDTQNIDQDGVNIIARELYLTQRRLAYLERTHGKYNQAKERIGHLICQYPRAVELYVELLKTCLREGLHRCRKLIAGDKYNGR